MYGIFFFFCIIHFSISDNVISTLPAFVKRELNELRIARREQLSLVDFVEIGADKNCLYVA